MRFIALAATLCATPLAAQDSDEERRVGIEVEGTVQAVTIALAAEACDMAEDEVRESAVTVDPASEEIDATTTERDDDADMVGEPLCAINEVRAAELGVPQDDRIVTE